MLLSHTRNRQSLKVKDQGVAMSTLIQEIWETCCVLSDSIVNNLYISMSWGQMNLVEGSIHEDDFTVKALSGC